MISSLDNLFDCYSLSFLESQLSHIELQLAAPKKHPDDLVNLLVITEDSPFF